MLDLFIVNTILIVVSIVVFIYFWNKLKNPKEKIMFIAIIIFIVVVPLTIYMLDKYNIPSKYNYINSDTNTNMLFDFVNNYLATILATIMSGALLVLVTFEQIKSQKESNKEDKRLQNIPILEFSVLTEFDGTIIECVEDTNLDASTNKFYINIENIGLNHARSLKLEINVNDAKVNNLVLLEENQITLLKKDSSVCFKYLLILNDKCNIVVDVYYEDLLKNKYKQKISFNATPTKVHKSGDSGGFVIISNIVISEEELIKEK